MKFFKIKLLAFCIAVLTLHVSFAQKSRKDKDDEKGSQISSLLNSKDFVFIAQTAVPMGGRTINLTTFYDLRVSKDTMVSDLPYFGRAFVAPMNPSEGGFRFTSTSFDYQVQERKKGGWNVILTPKDTRDVRQLSLSISRNGYGSLQVTSNSRQAISFNGFLRERTSI
jgi:hypothetical protein